MKLHRVIVVPIRRACAKGTPASNAMLTFTEDDVKNRAVGDIFTLHGERVRLVKKTNYVIAVEPYTWLRRAEDWVNQKLGLDTQQ